jgi:hypothetical protein
MAISGCKWLLTVMLIICVAYPIASSSHALLVKHPFYVSVTEINHNSKDRILEVSCKIFTNDFETSLEKFSHLKIDLSDLKSKEVSEKYMSAYITQHLQIKVDGRPVNLLWVGEEKEAEGTWSYFQINGVSAVKRIDIVNSLLYESFSSEINIMHVRVGGVRKSTKVSNPDTDASFEF